MGTQEKARKVVEVVHEERGVAGDRLGVGTEAWVLGAVAWEAAAHGVVEMLADSKAVATAVAALWVVGRHSTESNHHS